MRRSWLRSFGAGLIVVGAVTGYLVSSGLGARLLHQEIETQLTRLMEGSVEVGEVQVHLDDGFRLEIRDLEAYPGTGASPQPAVRARRVVAWVDVLALLIGRLELSTLLLESPFVRIEQDASGGFPDLPLPADGLGPIGNDDDGNDWGEALVTRVEGLDDVANAFFEGIRAANRIEIHDGTMHWLRPDPDDLAGEPLEIRLELFSTVIERDWLLDDVGLELSAVFVDGRHAPFPFAVAVARGDEGKTFDWTVSLSQIPLEAAETPLSFVESIEGLSGQLTAALHLHSAADGVRRLKIDGQIHNAIVELQRSGTTIEREEVSLGAEIVIGSKRLQLVDGHVQGKRLGFDLKGTLARPIRPTSKLRLESRMVGFQLEDVFEQIRSLEAESETARSIMNLVERVAGGRIRYVESAGSAGLSQWRRLFTGRATELPDDFLLGVAFEDVRVDSQTQDPITDLHGKVEWVEDQLSFLDTTAVYRDEPLPTMNLVIDGMSHLRLTPDDERDASADPPPIPGHVPLLELIRPRDPDALPPVKAIGLAIEHLDHPLLRFPFEDLRVLIEPLREGMQIHVREGRWGGASVMGDLTLGGYGDARTITARLELGDADNPVGAEMAVVDEAPLAPSSPGANADPEPEAELDADSPVVAAADRTSKNWGKGRFELEFRPRPTLPFRTATGFFRLEGTQLIANEVQFEIESVGEIAARIRLDLAETEQVGVDLSFAATGALLQHIEAFIGLTPGTSRGTIGATGSLRGSIRPSESLIERLDGRIRVEASDGAIETEVPLLFRLSRASEGYNLFNNDDELKFETLTTTIDFQQGSLLAEDFEIEGPVRLFARGRIEPLAMPSQVSGVIGVFLFRAPNQVLESLPLVRFFLPGSERGLIGAYFDVKGALRDPSVETLPVATLMTAVPAAIKAPFKVLQYLFEPSDQGS